MYFKNSYAHKSNAHFVKVCKRSRPLMKKVKPRHHYFKNRLQREIYTNFAMSSWVENFTLAATWQQNYQLTLQNNKINRMGLANDYISGKSTINRNVSSNTLKHAGTVRTRKSIEILSSCSDDELEVSEEYIAFLKANEPYKAAAKLEREKLRKARLQEHKVEENLDATCIQEKPKLLHELYGHKWESIKNLETLLELPFQTKSDHNGDKHFFWPNIPLNLNYN